eukprot:comp82332_c0_seq1/m.48405 comp82332_c0_seq1/g.48405  ORF comp82332_c0_seq1/g.48405 comp82332_c0_seq1/m.48405 type:complete len:268 (-) comp82332_c0_seq1:91-894(-)
MRGQTRPPPPSENGGKLQAACSWLRSAVQRRIVEPIMGVLKAGITPNKLALSLSFGIVCGLFPIPGTTIILCFIITLLLGLNKVIIQVVNLILTPVNVLLIAVWYKLGCKVLGWDQISFSSSELKEAFGKDFMGTLLQFKYVVGGAVVGWAVIFPGAALVLYLLTYPVLKVVLPKLKGQRLDSQELMLDSLEDEDETELVEPSMLDGDSQSITRRRSTSQRNHLRSTSSLHEVRATSPDRPDRLSNSSSTSLGHDISDMYSNYYEQN